VTFSVPPALSFVEASMAPKATDDQVLTWATRVAPIVLNFDYTNVDEVLEADIPAPKMVITSFPDIR
jgi:hypothetical protein